MGGFGKFAVTTTAVTIASTLVSVSLANASFATASSTILSGKEATALSRPCSRRAPGPVTSLWTPTAAQIADFERRLEPLLAKALSDDRANEVPRFRPSAPDYFRQYAGFDVGGRRIIYANGVHRDEMVDSHDPFGIPAEHSRDWHDRAITICDGGIITFGVEYDVKTKELSKFSFNGQL